MSYAFQAEGLVKRFGKTTALAGIDLAVHTGEVHCFLGPNGAGKTTTIRILLGLLHADAGTASLLGGDPWKNVSELHRRLAYVPGDVSLWPTLSGGEVIDMLGRLRGGLDQRRRADLLDSFELDPRKKGRAYSKGNRQKVALVAALASNAELLVLDEPTSGLDPLMAEVFRHCITEVRQEGRTVLLASHILAEVEKPAACRSRGERPMTPLTGTLTLAGLALRRDRIKLLLWVLLAAGLVAGTASSIKGLYVTLAERQHYAVAVGANPASAVLGGPGFGLSTLGGITVAEVGSTLLALVALASILLVVRYVRTEEETGRAELIGSGVVGRHARLAAALLVVGGANLMIATLTIAALIGYGLPVAGSVAFGLAVAGA